MKRFQFTAFVAICLCFTFSSFALYSQNLLLGIKAGVNFDKTQGRNLDNNFNGSFLGGAYAGVRFSKVRVKAEALFSRGTVSTGDNFKDAFGSYLSQGAQDIREGTFKMNELSIPVLVGIQVVPRLLWLEAGPQYTGVVSIKDVNGFLRESKDVFKGGYLSGVVGAGAELPFSLNAGIRYIFGISDRNNTNVSEAWRTSHIQIHVGWGFLK